MTISIPSGTITNTSGDNTRIHGEVHVGDIVSFEQRFSGAQFVGKVLDIEPIGHAPSFALRVKILRVPIPFHHASSNVVDTVTVNFGTDQCSTIWGEDN